MTTVIPTRLSASSPSSRARRPLPRVYGLADAVIVGLDALSDPLERHPAVHNGQLEALLRAAIDHALRIDAATGHAAGRASVMTERGAAAARVACAFLAASNPDEAYFVLLTAENLLVGRPHVRPVGPSRTG